MIAKHVSPERPLILTFVFLHTVSPTTPHPYISKYKHFALVGEHLGCFESITLQSIQTATLNYRCHVP
jgi:hypothetical protein